MIIKLSMLVSSLLRAREEKKVTEDITYTHKQWVMIDRIVIITLLIAAVILPLLIS